MVERSDFNHYSFIIRHSSFFIGSQNDFDTSVLVAAFFGFIGPHRSVKAVTAGRKSFRLNLPRLLKKASYGCCPGR
jgi:hypothetical protein